MSEADDALLIAQLDFTPVPPDKRHAPGRIAPAPARLYIDKFVEHREAWEFLQEMQNVHGEGVKTVVRALVHYQRTVIEPLERLLAAARLTAAQREELEALKMIALREPMAFPANRRQDNTVKSVAARLYVDKYMEHREAYKFLQAQDIHGDAQKTIVRALLHYRDSVIKPLRDKVSR